ncbi:11140_t:CDS:1, partial [Dentiscutata erythropus]
TSSPTIIAPVSTTALQIQTPVPPPLQPTNKPQSTSQNPPAQPYVPAVPSPQIPTQLPYGAGAEKLRSERGNVGMVALGITIFLVVIW